MRKLLILSLLTFAGCGDPATSRLAEGSRARIVSRDGEHERVYLSKSGSGRLPGLVLGTHVSVVDDTEEPGPRSDPDYRKVKVHVEDGEFRGVTGVLTRWDLRPE